MLCHPSVHGLSDNRTRGQVHHHSQVEPALFCPDRGDGTGPFLIRRCRTEILLEQIRCDRLQVLRISRDCDFLGLNRLQSQRLHSSGNAVFVVRGGPIVWGGSNSGRAIPLAMLNKDSGDPSIQVVIQPSRSLRPRPVQS